MSLNKDGRIRKNVTIGSLVQIMVKQDGGKFRQKKGVVESILTAAAKHAQGIKVKLTSGESGHIKKILSVKKILPTDIDNQIFEDYQ